MGRVEARPRNKKLTYRVRILLAKLVPISFRRRRRDTAQFFVGDAHDSHGKMKPILEVGGSQVSTLVIFKCLVLQCTFELEKLMHWTRPSSFTFRQRSFEPA